MRGIRWQVKIELSVQVAESSWLKKKDVLKASSRKAKRESEPITLNLYLISSPSKDLLEESFSRGTVAIEKVDERKDINSWGDDNK